MRNMWFTKKADGSMKAGRMMGLFLIVHGLMHYGVASAPNPDGSAGVWMLDPSTSVFSTLGLGAEVVTGIGVALAGVAALGFMMSGISFLARKLEKARGRLVLISSVFSLALLFGFFNIYWLAGIAIDIVLIALFASKALPERAVKAVTTE
jgi:hypothetical protein